MIKLERRQYQLSTLNVRDRSCRKQDGVVISGYAAVFNSLSQFMWGFREQIEPGAFADSLDGDVRALWNHDTAKVLGRTTSGTLSLREDSVGLRIKITPPEQAAWEIESIRRGDVSQMSFGFSVLDDDWSQDDDGMVIRTLLKVKLFEVSPVTFPAYTETSVTVSSAARNHRQVSTSSRAAASRLRQLQLISL